LLSFYLTNQDQKHSKGNKVNEINTEKKTPKTLTYDDLVTSFFLEIFTYRRAKTNPFTL